jgi:hypothetical protein
MAKIRRMPINLQMQRIKCDIVNAGHEPDKFDVAAHIDSTLSYNENRKNIANICGYKIGDKQIGTSSRRGGQMSNNLNSLLSQADEFNKAEKRRRANERQRAKGPRPAKKVSKATFKKMKPLSAWQCDGFYIMDPAEKKQDSARMALRPGRRRSKSGKIYYERRRNRSDMPGSRI